MEDHHETIAKLKVQYAQEMSELKTSINLLLVEVRAQTSLYVQCQERIEMTVPAGDYDGHRRYHEAVIAKMEARSKMWQDVASSVAKWGVIGILTWLSWAIWHEFILQVFKSAGKV